MDRNTSEPRNTAQRDKSSHFLAWLLDSSIPLPGGYRIGLDGLIGLIPGVGDAIGGGLSTWIFYQGYKQGVPRMILLRMLINILIDAVVGAIPLLGDLFDFVWKANLKNVELLENYKMAPGETYRRTTASTVIFLVGLAFLAFLFIYLIIAIFALLWQRLTQGGN